VFSFPAKCSETGIDLIPASLLIDTQSPLEVLQAMADHDFSQLLAIPLRDGCDLMDVIGRRWRGQAAQ
jgi:hypothetical protein